MVVVGIVVNIRGIGIAIAIVIIIVFIVVIVVVILIVVVIVVLVLVVILLMPKILHDLGHRTYLTWQCPFPRNPSVSMLHRHGVMQDFGQVLVLTPA